LIPRAGFDLLILLGLASPAIMVSACLP